MLTLNYGILNYNTSTGSTLNDFIIEVTTVSSNYTVTIPTLNGSYVYDYTVDYGDGTVLPVSSWNDPNATHEYVTPSAYTLTIRGTCESFWIGWSGNMYDRITKVLQWGNTGLKIVNFYGCYNMTSIPTDTQGAFSKVTNFAQSFGYCYNLASIPETLFNYAISATTFEWCFYGYFTYGFSFPENLFRYNTLVTSFYATFYNCYITSIPAGIFKYNTLASNFSLTFGYCYYLSAIPDDLFKYNTLASDFTQTFDNVTAIASIPLGLFTGLTATYPYFYHTFYKCANITSAVPTLWLDFPLTTGPDCFAFDSNISNYSSIPEEWGGPIVKMRLEIETSALPYPQTIVLPHLSGYSYNYIVDYGDGTVLPVTSWNDPNTIHSYYSGGLKIIKISGVCETFCVNAPSGDTIQTALKRIIYWGNNGLQRFNFSGCTGLTTITPDSSNYLTSVTDFSYSFAYCTAMYSAVPNFWIQYSAITGTNCFTGDTEAYNYSYIPSTWGGLGGTATPFKMEVTVPAYHEAQIPQRYQNANGDYTYQYKYNIDWGDGTPILSVNSYNDPNCSHVYVTGGTYVIQISGICECISCWQGTNAYKLTPIVTKLIQWGQIQLIEFSLMGCSILTDVLATDGQGASLILGDYSLGYSFYSCGSLTGLTSTMFSNCKRANSFQYAFYFCTSLPSIPAGLFDASTGSTFVNDIYFYSTFAYCTALTGDAPELWNVVGPPYLQGSGCFAGDTGLTNYATAQSYGWA